jgi:hypothetical protein
MVDAIPEALVVDEDVPAKETLEGVVDCVVEVAFVAVGFDVDSSVDDKNAPGVPRSKVVDDPIVPVALVNGPMVLGAAPSVGVRSTATMYTDESQPQAVRSGSSTIVKATQ